ncbi:hypothetical protein CR513_32960, partial [Mucuna pruriens]
MTITRRKSSIRSMVLISPNANSMGNENFVTCLNISKQIVGKERYPSNFSVFESNFVEVPSNTWWLDIGATIHVSNSLQEFKSIHKPNKGEMMIIIGNGASLDVEHIGVISLKLSSRHVLTLKILNLISVSVLDNCGYSFHFSNKKFTLSYDFIIVGFGVLHNGLYMLDVFSAFDTEKYLVLDLNVVGLLKTLPCYGTRKLNANVRKSEVTRSKKVLQLIHIDSCVPITHVAQVVLGTSLPLLIIFQVELLHERSKCLDAFKTFKVITKLKFGIKLICVRSDRGGEFYGKYNEIGRNHGPFARFLKDCGIKG